MNVKQIPYSYSAKVLICLLIVGWYSQSSLFAQYNNTFDQKKKVKKAAPSNFKPAIKKGAKIPINKATNKRKNIAFPSLRPLQLHTNDAQKNIRQLRNLDDKVRLNFSESNGTPIFITGKQLHKAKVSNNGKINHTATALSFMDANKALLKMEQPSEEFKVRKIENDELGGTHIRLDQQYKSLKIWASDVSIHLNDKGVETFNGRYHPTPKLETTTPSLAVEKAIKIGSLNKRFDLVLFEKAKPKESFKLRKKPWKFSPETSGNEKVCPVKTLP